MSTGALSLVVQNGQLLVVRGPPAECHTLSSPDPRAIATLFESQGIGIEDVAASAYVLEKARAAGMGMELPF